MTKTEMTSKWAVLLENGKVVGEEFFNGTGAVPNDGILAALDRRVDTTPEEINAFEFSVTPIPLTAHNTILYTNSHAYNVLIAGVYIFIDSDPWVPLSSIDESNVKFVLTAGGSDIDIISSLQLNDLIWFKAFEPNLTNLSYNPQNEKLGIYIPLNITLENAQVLSMETVLGAGTDLFGAANAEAYIIALG